MSQEPTALCGHLAENPAGCCVPWNTVHMDVFVFLQDNAMAEKAGGQHQVGTCNLAATDHRSPPFVRGVQDASRSWQPPHMGHALS